MAHAPARHVLAARVSTPAAIGALRARHHVYVPPDGRINIAGVSDANVDRVADSIVAVMG